VPAGRQVRMGAASREAGRRAIDALEQGLILARAGDVQALVTAPVSKESFRLAAYGFPGHTEWLAERCGVKDVAMLMVAGPLRAILMTRHVPLKDVSSHLTSKLVKKSAELGYQFVKNYILPHPNPLPMGEGDRRSFSHREKAVAAATRMRRKPRLAICGVNPHAGDHGIIGHEEQTVYAPALRALRQKGIMIAGPLPSDTVFPKMARGQYDLALAAYHDQGMIPLKLYASERMVNVTLGLPFIRTSPAHGTAYDIAGKRKADPRPMIEAIVLAATYSR
jgi:4-hydroxythreonine-4-phosphate dehydrogenase